MNDPYRTVNVVPKLTSIQILSVSACHFDVGMNAVVLVVNLENEKDFKIFIKGKLAGDIGLMLARLSSSLEDFRRLLK